MPPVRKITVYTNDGTEILGSVQLIEAGEDGYNVYVYDNGIGATANPTAGYSYIYDGPGKWLGISRTPNATSPEYGPDTYFSIKANSNVYAVIKNTVNIDLSTLSGYQTLANGTYSLRVKAKANGYTDSAMSASVSWKKKAFTEVVPTLTHPFALNIDIYAPNAPFCRISNMNTSKIYTLHIEQDPEVEGYLHYASNAWIYTASQSTNNVYIYAQSQDQVELYTGSHIGYTHGLDSIAVLRGNTVATIYDFRGVQYYAVLPGYTCIIEGTLITLADRTKKPIEDITYDDDLLVWNFYEGKFDSTKPVWITKPRLAHEYNLCKFSNGVEVGFVGNGGNEGYHRIYNDEAKAFTHTGVAETPIGTHTFAEDGSFPELISQKVIKTPIRYYNIGTKEHINLFSNGILTSSRISNKYAIKNMKYIGDRIISEKDEQEYIKHKLELC